VHDHNIRQTVLKQSKIHFTAEQSRATTANTPVSYNEKRKVKPASARRKASETERY
jgi:hypothetical protein